MRRHLVLAITAGSWLLGGCNHPDTTTQARGALTVQPSALDFGARCSGGAGAELSVHLVDTGLAPVQLTSLRIAHAAGQGTFSVGTFPAQLSPGQGVDVRILYRPGSASHDTASLIIDSSATSSPELIVPLSAQAKVCPADAGGTDAGEPDAGAVDAGPADAGPVDAGELDAGPADAGEVDAGLADAGEIDAGLADAGEIDAGAPVDAGSCTPITSTQAIRSYHNVGLGHLVWNGQGYAATWFEAAPNGAPGWVIQTELLTPQGTPIGAVNALPSTKAVDPRIAFNGTDYAVVWGDDRGPIRQVYFGRLDATASFVAGSEVQLAPSANSQGGATVVWNPTAQEWATLWLDGYPGSASVNFMRLTRAGAVVPGSLRVLNHAPASGPYGSGSGPLVWNGAVYGAAWSEANTLDVQELGADGTPGAIAVVNPGATVTPDRIALASSGIGSVWGVAWMDARTGTNQVHFARVQAGSYVAGSDVLLGTPGRNDSGEPSAIWAGTAFAIAWDDQAENSGDVFVARITSAGTLLSRNDVVATPSWDAWPDLAWDGCNLAVTSTQVAGSFSSQNVVIGP